MKRVILYTYDYNSRRKGSIYIMLLNILSVTIKREGIVTTYCFKYY